MGLFNVIRLANDYVKAKKMLKKTKISKVDATKIKELMDRLHQYIDTLNETKDYISGHIQKVKEVMRNLSDKLKTRKVGKV